MTRGRTIQAISSVFAGSLATGVIILVFTLTGSTESGRGARKPDAAIGMLGVLLSLVGAAGIVVCQIAKRASDAE